MVFLRFLNHLRLLKRRVVLLAADDADAAVLVEAYPCV